MHIAELVSYTGHKTYWKSEPGWYEDVYQEALAVMRDRLPNANIRLSLAR